MENQESHENEEEKYNDDMKQEITKTSESEETDLLNTPIT